MSVDWVPYQGYEERVFEAEWSGDGECGVEAAQQSPEQDEFTDVRLHGETSQVETQSCQVLWMVQGVLTHNMHTHLIIWAPNRLFFCLFSKYPQNTTVNELCGVFFECSNRVRFHMPPSWFTRWSYSKYKIQNIILSIDFCGEEKIFVFFLDHELD